MELHRVVLINKIDDPRLYRPFEPGETLLSGIDYDWLVEFYPNSFVEIKMADSDWMTYLPYLVHESYLKACRLQEISALMGIDIQLPDSFKLRTTSLGQIAIKGERIEPELYGGGLSDAMNKCYAYIIMVKNYEELVNSRIDSQGRKM